jgi:hypothetical protein
MEEKTQPQLKKRENNMLKEWRVNKRKIKSQRKNQSRKRQNRKKNET